MLPARRHYLFANNGAAGYSGTVPGNTTYGTGITDDGGVALLKPDNTIVDQVGLSAGSAYKEGTPLTSLGASNLNQVRAKAGRPERKRSGHAEQHSRLQVRAERSQNALSAITQTIIVSPPR
jgi:hypothetical protein